MTDCLIVAVARHADWPKHKLLHKHKESETSEGSSEPLRQGRNVAHENGVNPLMISAIKGRIKEVERILRDGSCDMMGVDNQGLSELDYAIWNGQKKIVDLLLNAGGVPLLSISRRNKFSCLHFACQLGRADIVEALLWAGGEEFL